MSVPTHFLQGCTENLHESRGEPMGAPRSPSATPRFLLAGLLAFALLAASAPVTRASESPDEIDPLSAITPAGAKETVRYLASEDLKGRRAGTRGARLASEFIARHFEASGLEPGGDGGTWFQAVDVPPASLPAEGNALKIHGVRRVFELDPLSDFVPFGFAPCASATAPVVFAGYGISEPRLGWDDYAGLDVKGKIVLVLRHGPATGKLRKIFQQRGPREALTFHTKAKAAQEHGAAGMILVSDPRSLEGRDRLAYLVGAEQDIDIPCVHAAQKVGRALLALVGDTLENRQERMDASGTPLPAAIPEIRVEMTTAVKRGRPSCNNVVGVLKGSDPALRDECVVIGAHYDHLGYGDIGAMGGEPGEIFYGADDNASGAAAVLEAAAAFGATPIRPRRTLVFVAFTGEEIGLYGSRFHAGHPVFPPERTVAMINLDMVGRVRGNRLTVMGAASGKGLDALFKACNETTGFHLTLPGAAYAGSDHTPFYQKKIPAVFLFAGVHPHYHKPTDTWDRLNYEGLAKAAKLLYLAAARLASRDGRPAFRAIQTPGRSRRRGPRLGVMPDFGFEGEGARLAGVSPGTPASKAGLEAGDVIVAFKGRAVKSMTDLLTLLPDVKPGEKVKVVYLREGKRKETEVQFEK